jgi:hypothetical protein
VRSARAAFLAALLSLSGCDWPFESDDYQTRLAGIWEVTAPDTVDAGSEFEVVMLSSAPNGCWRAGRTDVRQANPLSATLIPYDMEYVGDGVCTTDVPTLRHSVNLLASKKGTFEVNVRRSGGSTIGRTVIVR